MGAAAEVEPDEWTLRPGDVPPPAHPVEHAVFHEGKSARGMAMALPHELPA